MAIWGTETKPDREPMHPGRIRGTIEAGARPRASWHSSSRLSSSDIVAGGSWATRINAECDVGRPFDHLPAHLALIPIPRSFRAVSRRARRGGGTGSVAGRQTTLAAWAKSVLA